MIEVKINDESLVVYKASIALEGLRKEMITYLCLSEWEKFFELSRATKIVIDSYHLMPKKIKQKEND
ncbi:MAG: hypothetical protein U9O94_02935 [Nanoarchaeota archaeon]|nr:hypothetical protein [Nanoarchaeota archaeon]